MSDTLQVALIALGGVALGGLLTGWFQRANTKTLVSAEMHRLKTQLAGEAKSRLLAQRQEGIIATVPKLIAAADPELHASFDYPEVVTLIHRIELLIDPGEPAALRLNQAIGQLGFAVQAAESGDRDNQRLLRAQSEVTEAAREVLRSAT